MLHPKATSQAPDSSTLLRYGRGRRPFAIGTTTLSLFLAAAAGVAVAPAQGPPATTTEPTLREKSSDAPNPAGAPSEPEVDPKLKKRAKQWAAVFFFGILLLVILVVASLAIIRFSSRFRQFLRAEDDDRPTADGDVWAMHKLPDLDGATPEDDDADPFDPDEPDDPPGQTG